ncbi:MAG: hypothetical protein HO274_03725 [Ferrovum myxofaciens]|uniref:hypothetical protein n=1 Tax=Ferrovum myxofaciens TaxID=416213 RepID=UPI002353316B|nr:hypothetical protein [Ferrovum myxofaciens]QKE39890.1 MAG: hypothetical protein HO274_03725 [Ferrovum myxofaciens]
MSEKIFASVIGGDETVTFRIVEPLNCTCCHVCFPVDDLGLKTRVRFEFQGQQTAKPVMQTTWNQTPVALLREFGSGRQGGIRFFFEKRVVLCKK